MTDDEIRVHLFTTVLRVRPSSRRWYDRWNHPDSLREKMLVLEEKVADIQRQLAAALMGPIEEVAGVLREWWNAQPGMPYTAPSLWDASQMAAA